MSSTPSSSTSLVVLTPPFTYSRLIERIQQRQQQHHQRSSATSATSSSSSSSVTSTTPSITMSTSPPLITYRDGDGDTITVTSDRELCEMLRATQSVTSTTSATSSSSSDAALTNSGLISQSYVSDDEDTVLLSHNTVGTKAIEVLTQAKSKVSQRKQQQEEEKQRIVQNLFPGSFASSSYASFTSPSVSISESPSFITFHAMSSPASDELLMAEDAKEVRWQLQDEQQIDQKQITSPVKEDMKQVESFQLDSSFVLLSSDGKTTEEVGKKEVTEVKLVEDEKSSSSAQSNNLEAIGFMFINLLVSLSSYMRSFKEEIGQTWKLVKSPSHRPLTSTEDCKKFCLMFVILAIFFTVSYFLISASLSILIPISPENISPIATKSLVPARAVESFAVIRILEQEKTINDLQKQVAELREYTLKRETEERERAKHTLDAKIHAMKDQAAIELEKQGENIRHLASSVAESVESLGTWIADASIQVDDHFNEQTAIVTQHVKEMLESAKDVRPPMVNLGSAEKWRALRRGIDDTLEKTTSTLFDAAEDILDLSTDGVSFLFNGVTDGFQSLISLATADDEATNYRHPRSRISKSRK